MLKIFKTRFKFTQDNAIIVVPTLELKAELNSEGVFTASGTIIIRGKWVSSGQCLDEPEFAEWGKRDKNIAELLDMWRNWHLNTSEIPAPVKARMEELLA